MSKPTRRQKIKAQRKAHPTPEAIDFDKALTAVNAQFAAQFEPDYQPPVVPPGTIWDVG